MATAPHVQLGSSAIEVVAGNAFRILGLPARASEGDVRIAASAMRSGLKLGITKNTVWDSPWLGPLSRTEETVEDAVARLRDPARRLRERFFWFHDGDELMPSLALASLENTASRWSLAPGLSARHDAALLMLLAAVLSDPEVQNESQWLRALREWKQVIEADDYWAALWAADAEGDFRPAATVEEVEALREEAFHLVGGILATVAREAVTRDALPSCRRALRVFNRARLPQEVLAVLESEVFAPIEAHLDAVCAELRRLCGAAEALPSPSASSEPGEERAATRADCEAALARFDAEVEPALRKIEELAGAGSDQTRRAQEATALCLEALALSDVWSTDTTSAQALLRRARLIAPSYSPVASRIEASLATMAVRAQQERQFKSAKPNEGSPEPAPVAAPAPPPPTGPASLPAAPGPPAARSEPGREFPGSPIWENLKPVKRPPPLFNLIGFGFGLYGKSDIDLDTRSYLTTHYLTALFLPLLPLGRYRIRDTMKGHRFLGRAPFGRRNVWHLLFLLALIVASPVLSSYRDVARSLPLLATPTPTVTATPTLRPTPRPTRTPSPTPTLTPSPTVAPTATPTVIVYVVQPGDVLNVIASRYGVTIEAILAANPQITNPDSLEIGQEIVIPQPPQ